MNVEFIKYWKHGSIIKKIPKDVSSRFIVNVELEENEKFDHQREFGIIFKFGWVGFLASRPVRRTIFGHPYYRRWRLPIVLELRIDRRWVFLHNDGTWKPQLKLGWVVHETVGFAAMNPNAVRSFILHS